MHISGLIHPKKKIPYFLGVFIVVLIVSGLFLGPQLTRSAAQVNLQWEQREVDLWNIRTYDRRFWHKDAQRYCQQLELDNHYDWRLPTLDELKSLLQISAGRRKSAARVERAIYWTATPYDEESHRFWALSFLSDQAAPMEIHNYNSVVCVRNIAQ